MCRSASERGGFVAYCRYRSLVAYLDAADAAIKRGALAGPPEPLVWSPHHRDGDRPRERAGHLFGA